MNNFFTDNSFSTQSILGKIDGIREQVIYYKTKYPLDREANMFLDWCLREFGIVVSLIQMNPRFNWVDVQREMDRLYKKDKGITAYLIDFKFRQSSNPHWGKININMVRK